jgi:hypothetical protein
MAMISATMAQTGAASSSKTSKTNQSSNIAAPSLSADRRYQVYNITP